MDNYVLYSLQIGRRHKSFTLITYQGEAVLPIESCSAFLLFLLLLLQITFASPTVCVSVQTLHA